MQKINITKSLETYIQNCSFPLPLFFFCKWFYLSFTGDFEKTEGKSFFLLLSYSSWMFGRDWLCSGKIWAWSSLILPCLLQMRPSFLLDLKAWAEEEAMGQEDRTSSREQFVPVSKWKAFHITTKKGPQGICTWSSSASSSVTECFNAASSASTAVNETAMVSG